MCPRLKIVILRKQMTLCATHVLLVVSMCILQCCASVLVANVHYNATSGTFAISTDVSSMTMPLAAKVSFEDSFYSVGWDLVHGVGNETYLNADATSWIAYQAVGYGEGYLTQQRIYQNYQNTYIGSDGFGPAVESPHVAEWINAHYSYMVTRAQQTDAIGVQLRNLLALVKGIAEGYAAAVTHPSEALNETEIFWLNFQDEAGDIVTAYMSGAEQSFYAQFPHLDPRRHPRHCSALIKVLPTDIYFSHVTWSAFNTMMRMYKTYAFGTKFVSLSGYPGVIHSIDDWYMTSQQLAVMETTNGVPNVTLFTTYVRNNQDSISEFLRVMIANFLASTSAEWVTYFSTENSGTYNNQWMVLDMKSFVPGEQLPTGSFYVAEQLPGPQVYPVGVTSADLTSHLNTIGYWASYNIPYFSNVYNVSGNLEAFLANGTFFSYTNYTRAEIFRRNQSMVTDLTSMQALMRYNDYRHDPYSVISDCIGARNNTCNPDRSAMLAIASRGDLNPPGGILEYGPNYMFLTQRNHVATDVKIALWSEMAGPNVSSKSTPPNSTFVAYIINGPSTYNDLPVFSWSTSPFASDPTIVRLGLPDVYNFPFVKVPGFALPVASDGGDDSTSKKIAVGVGSAAALLVLGAVVFLVFRSRNAEKEELDGAPLM